MGTTLLCAFPSLSITFTVIKGLPLVFILLKKQAFGKNWGRVENNPRKKIVVNNY